MGWSSGQIIALCRLILASVFLLAVFLDPSQPVGMPETGLLLLGGYASTAFILLVIAFSSYWLDFRLARFVHLLDLVMFGAVVYMTEGYTSPFFTFSVFLLLSAGIRWSARETALTALAVNALFLGAGALAQVTVPLELDLQRLLIRSAYLIVLSALFILFAFNAEGVRRARRLRSGVGAALRDVPFAEAALRHVQDRLSSAKTAIVWRDPDEPRGWISVRERGETSERALPSSQVDWAMTFRKGVPHLFETMTSRRLWGGPRPVIGTLTRNQVHGLAQQDLASGLALPIRTETLEATIFASEIPNLSSDLLVLGEVLIDDLAQMAESAAYLHVVGEATEARVRVNLARDLHDSVAQFLAGVSFRLEALRRSDRSAAELRDDIERFQDELASEQLHLRELITELRRNRSGVKAPEFSSGLAKLCHRLADQWQIEMACNCDEGLAIPAAMEGEIRQMIREAVANAVRHGRADKVAIGIALAEGALLLTIADNGSGLAKADGSTIVLPRSLEERARALGGSMIVSNGSGTSVELSLPIGGAG